MSMEGNVCLKSSKTAFKEESSLPDMTDSAVSLKGCVDCVSRSFSLMLDDPELPRSWNL